MGVDGAGWRWVRDLVIPLIKHSISFSVFFIK